MYLILQGFVFLFQLQHPQLHLVRGRRICIWCSTSAGASHRRHLRLIGIGTNLERFGDAVELQYMFCWDSLHHLEFLKDYIMDTNGYVRCFLFPPTLWNGILVKNDQKKIPKKRPFFGNLSAWVLEFLLANLLFVSGVRLNQQNPGYPNKPDQIQFMTFFPNKIILYFPTWKGTQSGLTTRLKKRSFGTIQIQILFTTCPKLLDQFPRRSLWFTGNLISFCHKLLAAKSIQRNFVTPNPNLDGSYTQPQKEYDFWKRPIFKSN